jgi:hypothetical protein
MPSFHLKNNTVPPICSAQPYCEQALLGWTHIYQPLHTGGGYPDGSRTTKILWVLNVSAPPDTVVITGVKMSSPHETFQQTFPIAGAPGPGGDYPSIVTIPAPGCWQIQVNGAASLIFWVTGN